MTVEITTQLKDKVNPTPHPADFGIPKEYWRQAQHYANYWHMKNQPAQKTQEFIHDPAEIRRVFEIDEADYPPPDSGFAKLGGM